MSPLAGTQTTSVDRSENQRIKSGADSPNCENAAQARGFGGPANARTGLLAVWIGSNVGRSPHAAPVLLWRPWPHGFIR